MAQEKARKLPKKLGPGDDLEMFQTPDQWPQWPRLPVTRGAFAAPGGQGVLVEEDLLAQPHGVKPVVYISNIWKLDLANLPAYPKEEYPTFEALLAAGWRVD